MKKTLFAICIAIVLLAGIVVTGCTSSPKTPEEEAAQVKVNEAKQELNEAQNAATAEEWEAFKIESAEKIRINELSIADFKDKMSVSESKYDAIYAEKIDKLERQNKNLKTRIESYEKRKSNWASFKSEFNHDMDEIGTALNDLLLDKKNK